MVVQSEDGDPEALSAGEAHSYLIDMSEEMARLSLRVGAPAAALHFLEAARALRQLQPNAAPGDAA